MPSGVNAEGIRAILLLGSILVHRGARALIRSGLRGDAYIADRAAGDRGRQPACGGLADGSPSRGRNPDSADGSDGGGDIVSDRVGARRHTSVPLGLVEPHAEPGDPHALPPVFTAVG